ncbi:MAG: T9SS type A sorting domain-containing protein [Candidatus Cloacimonetes bacterium]|nr:T9SS type A sorting domain-containing protein [Candidatus Cloacimonadota bacterium]
MVTVFVECTSPTLGTESATFTGTLSDQGNYEYWAGENGLTLSGGGLPVELAAFTATYVVEEYAYISICWTTVSETDVAGFNIYRHTENNFSAADKINTSLIPGQGTTSETHDYTFEDDSFMENTTYYYWLEIQDIYGETSHSTVIEYDPENGSGFDETVFAYTYLANYPNPVTTSTTFMYAINGHKIDANVTINIYNVMEQLVETIDASGGTHSWNPGNMISGAYYYTLTADDYSKTKLMCYYPEDNIIGTTSNYGIFTTEEKIFFPSLYSLPDMVHTRFDPITGGVDSLGVFNYTDEVEIVISDTDSTNSQSYIETIQDNINYFEYVWPY